MKKRHSVEQIVAKLRQADVDLGKGLTVPEVCKQLNISQQTYYRWRKLYGGMGRDQLKELNRLQKENECLRRAISDLPLDKLILSEAPRGNF